MRCPECDAPAVAFTVPPALREHAPAAESAICSRCLRTVPASDAAEPDVADPDVADPDAADLSAIHESVPSGRAGVAFVLVLGKLDSLALERQSIETLCEVAEREGADVRLALERLAGAEGLAPEFDIERRTQQLASFR
ncbi:DUF6276 family protein [Halolamina salifodinae]|uniref:Small CPxCG-related zinc finger protein n=1 Tax=Halolamina salifodinae TaxID=1202767 RepID=A0A8T4GZ87_9EURY|nr:DUF6276 family protein [Halolamina salifodinae]MBP1986428.1 hypothetical protein [Halolamina salifodinae]